MPYHRLASTILGGAFCSLAYLACGLFTQPRTLVWYGQATALLAAEWVGAFFYLPISSLRVICRFSPHYPSPQNPHPDMSCQGSVAADRRGPALGAGREKTLNC